MKAKTHFETDFTVSKEKWKKNEAFAMCPYIAFRCCSLVLCKLVFGKDLSRWLEGSSSIESARENEKKKLR